ncbi:MAG: protein phosphatase 2C domain-containing protein [Gemmataceae bacterium]|nr:protein phosphatase 2C domain-containing protein [Gemmata sp.]MDW8198320.1 protein phosphatase 2C domain-containing protein [Gemmataceae bacterium]
MTQPPPDTWPAGCLVLLVRLSADMTGDILTGRGELPPVIAARQLADELLQALVDTLAAGYPIGHWDIAVVGYRASDAGAAQLVSLLPDGRPQPRYVPLAELAAMPVAPRDSEGQPRRWTLLPAAEGSPCPAAALAGVYALVSVWLTGRFTARPPVVIHCTGTAGFDRDYFRIARSLALLTTGYGPVRLLHYVWDAQADEGLHARLLGVSAELPGDPETGTAPRRGIWINDWDIRDPWEALFSGPWQQPMTTGGESTASRLRVRSLNTAKLGNTPEQWEDALAVDTSAAVAAIADGASSGIFCRLWAQQLCEGFVRDRPEVCDPTILQQWVNQLRQQWRAAIQYNNLNWSKKAKVDQVGAAATLLGWELGPAGSDGQRPWRACAIGDACLFWIRQNHLLATFPVVAAEQLGSTPLLVRSNPGFRTSALVAQGLCAPGDRFLLATDAVAAHFFQTLAETEPDWHRYETITPEEWIAELDQLRSSRQMVNDDCTLVVLTIDDTVVNECADHERLAPADAMPPLADQASPSAASGHDASPREQSAPSARSLPWPGTADNDECPHGTP